MDKDYSRDMGLLSLRCLSDESIELTKDEIQMLMQVISSGNRVERDSAKLIMLRMSGSNSDLSEAIVSVFLDDSDLSIRTNKEFLEVIFKSQLILSKEFIESKKHHVSKLFNMRYSSEYSEDLECAAELLLDLFGTHVIDPANDMVNDPNTSPDVQKAVRNFLIAINPESLKQMTDALYSEFTGNENLQARIVGSTLKKGINSDISEAMPHIFHFLDNGPYEVRRKITARLGYVQETIYDIEVQTRLFRNLEDEMDSIRSASASSLLVFLRKRQIPCDWETIINKLISESSEQVIQKLVSILLDPDIKNEMPEQLRKVLSCLNSVKLGYATEFLGLNSDQVKYILPFLKANNQLANKALYLLGKIGKSTPIPEAVDEIVGCLKKSELISDALDAIEKISEKTDVSSGCEEQILRIFSARREIRSKAITIIGNIASNKTNSEYVKTLYHAFYTELHEFGWDRDIASTVSSLLNACKSNVLPPYILLAIMPALSINLRFSLSQTALANFCRMPIREEHINVISKCLETGNPAEISGAAFIISRSKLNISLSESARARIILLSMCGDYENFLLALSDISACFQDETLAKLIPILSEIDSHQNNGNIKITSPIIFEIVDLIKKNSELLSGSEMTKIRKKLANYYSTCVRLSKSHGMQLSMGGEILEEKIKQKPELYRSPFRRMKVSA